MQTILLSKNARSVGAGLIAMLVLAGCVGHNGLGLPWSQTQDSRLEHVTAATFDQRVLKCDKPVLVDFYAEWCGPCKRLSPLVEEYAEEHPEVRVVKVNVDDCQELVKGYQVTGMPTLLVVRGGQVTARSTGLVPKAKLAELVGSGVVDGKGAGSRVSANSEPKGRQGLQ
jgi:thioredoxin 1